MTDSKITKTPICPSAELRSGGLGHRFEIHRDGVTYPAFVIRYREQVFGFVNRCAHRDLELDWSPGEFFDADSRYLICATHGALYEPQTGLCVAGPCKGQALDTLVVTEYGGTVYLGKESE